ncbi:MAG TPA: hypothetical protein VKK31_05820 [Thermoanaerobaculia bacterium]|nr:hypothetical protein [Thermoanaerobaculia bacterium]
MRGFLAVFERELSQRRLLAVLALGFGAVAVVMPILPGLHKGGSTLAELRGGMALGLALLLSALTAVYLGGSILASDLLERRLGFYFARPISGWALWAGKVAAAVALTFGAGLLVLLPAALFGGDLNLAGYWGLNVMDSPRGFVLWGIGLLFLLFAANAVSVMVRSRSPWIAFDLVALVVVAAVISDAWDRLRLVGIVPSGQPHGIDSLVWLTRSWAVVPLAAMAAAGAVQVLRGRTDLRRAHRALSGTLWGLLLAFAIGFEGFTFWMVSAGPEDLAGVTEVVAPPAGSSSPWVAMEGPAANRSGYSPRFLYDVTSGRTVRTGFSSPWWDVPVRISADGRRAVWLEFTESPYESPMVLYRLDLEAPGAQPVATPISFRFLPEGMAISPDGRRFAAVVFDRLTVDDVETGRLLAAVGLPRDTWQSRLAFPDPGHVRLYQVPADAGAQAALPEHAFDIVELDLATGKREATGRLSGGRGFVVWTLSPDGSRMILRTGSRLQLRDARTGELLASLGAGKQASASFLAGGRIAVPLSLPGARELQILAPDGTTELRRFRFEGVRKLALADQPAPGSLRIATSRTGDPRSPWEVRLLDLETGGVRSLGERKLAYLAPLSKNGGERLSLEGTEGVVWGAPFSVQERAVLKDASDRP